MRTTSRKTTPALSPNSSAPWPRSVRGLLLGTALTRCTSYAYPFLAYWTTTVAGQGAAAAGWIVAAYGLGWLVGQGLVGWACDVLGPRCTLVAGMLLGAAALGVMSVALSLPVLALSAVGAGLASDAPRPVVGAVVAAELPDHAARDKATTWRHGALNLGSAVTGATGGLLADRIGLRPLLWVDAAGCLLFAGIAVGVLPRTTAHHRRQQPGSYRSVVRDRGLLLLLVATLGALTCAISLFGALPLVMTHRGMPAASYGWVQVANAVAAVIVTGASASWLGRRGARGPMVGILAGGSVVLGVTLAAAVLAPTAIGIAAAVALAIPGEVGATVAASDILNRLAPAHLRGRYQGMLGATFALAGVVSPLLGSWALATGGPPAVAGALLLAGLGGAALCVPLARHLHNRQLTGEAPAIKRPAA